MLRLKVHVASVCFKCFIGMLQLFHMDVVKVDRDAAYAAMVVHICCKLLFPPCFICFFANACCKCVYLYVAYVLHICCKCFICFFLQAHFASVFICMLHMFHTYVVSVLSGYAYVL
jgi:hypothetical protein